MLGLRGEQSLGHMGSEDLNRVTLELWSEVQSRQQSTQKCTCTLADLSAGAMPLAFEPGEPGSFMTAFTGGNHVRNGEWRASWFQVTMLCQ